MGSRAGLGMERTFIFSSASKYNRFYEREFAQNENKAVVTLGCNPRLTLAHWDTWTMARAPSLNPWPEYGLLDILKNYAEESLFESVTQTRHSTSALPASHHQTIRRARHVQTVTDRPSFYEP